MRGERGDDHAPGRVADDPLERRRDDLLALGDALALGVRRVGEQQREPCLAEAPELREIGAPAVDRRVVDLEVARVQERALIGVQRDRDRVGDRVRDAHELGAERADLHRLAVRIDLDQLRVVADAVLVELGLDQPERQARAPDLGDADLAHQVRQRADVILVAVRQDDGAQRAGRVAQVAEVGQHEIDAHHLVAREAEPGVDQDALAVLLDHGHVLADLAEAAERDDPDGASPRHRVAVALESAARPNCGECGLDRHPFGGGRLDQREAEAADAMAEQIERSLDRNGIHRDVEGVEQRCELVVLRVGLVEPVGGDEIAELDEARRRRGGRRRRCRRSRRARGRAARGRRCRRRARGPTSTMARACAVSGVDCLTATTFGCSAATCAIEPGSTFRITRCGML